VVVPVSLHLIIKIFSFEEGFFRHLLRCKLSNKMGCYNSLFPFQRSYCMRFLLLFLLFLQTLSADSLIESPILKGQLDNGLTYYVQENTFPKGRAFLQLVVKVGSLNEEEQEQGVAHFLEHLVHRGTEHFKEEELWSFLESIGALRNAHSNASTGFDMTEYHFDIPIEKEGSLETTLTILRDFAGFATLSEDSLEKERHVVLDEMFLRTDKDFRRYQELIRQVYPDSRHRYRFPIGKEEVIRTVTAKTVGDFYKKWYQPHRMAVMAVGDFEGEVVVKAIKTLFASLPVWEQEAKELDISLLPTKGGQYIHFDSDLTGTELSLVFSEEPKTLSPKEKTASCAVRQLFKCRLKGKEEEGMFYDTGLYFYPFCNLNQLALRASFYETRAEEGLKAFLVELERIKRFGFTEKELLYWKNEEKILSELNLMNLDKREHATIADQFFDHFICKMGVMSERDRNILLLEQLEQLSLDDVNSCLASMCLQDGWFAFLSTSSKTLQQVLQEDNLFSIVDDVDLSSFSEVDVSFSIEPHTPPGEIVRTKKHPITGVVEWTLSNGVTVFLKKTDLERDKIDISAFAKGGLSLFSEEDFQSGSYSTYLFERLKNLSKHEKDLLFKQMGISFYGHLGLGNRSIYYGASNKGLETVFQSIYTHFTDLSLDEEDLDKAYLLEKELENQLKNDPQAQFTEFTENMISGGHYTCARSISSKPDVESVKKAFSKLYGNANDFTFTVVGDFQEEHIEALIKKYIASLPKSENENKPVCGSVPSYLQVESKQADFVCGKQQLSCCDIFYVFDCGSRIASRSDFNALNVFSIILSNRLWEVLRIEDGKTYGTFAEFISPFEPDLSFSLLKVRFTSSIEDRNELLAKALKEIEALTLYPPKEKEVSNLIEYIKENRKQNRQLNSYWNNKIQFSRSHGIDLESILDDDNIDKKLTPEFIWQVTKPLLESAKEVILFHIPEE